MRPGERGGGPAGRLLPDELAHAGLEHLDPAYVAGYDHKSGFDRFPDLDPASDVEALVALGVGPASTVVDLGSGTGRFALRAAERFGRVVAVDVSPAMLAVTRARAAAAAAGNLEVVEAGWLTYEHRGAPADAVYSRNALHQLPDFWKVLALDRVAAMLRPGGVLLLRDLVFDFAPEEALEVLEQWMDGAVEDPAEGYTRDDFAEHLRSEHSTFRWLLEPMLEAVGFEILEARFVRSVYATYTCVRSGASDPSQSRGGAGG